MMEEIFQIRSQIHGLDSKFSFLGIAQYRCVKLNIILSGELEREKENLIQKIEKEFLERYEREKYVVVKSQQK